MPIILWNDYFATFFPICILSSFFSVIALADNPRRRNSGRKEQFLPVFGGNALSVSGSTSIVLVGCGFGIDLRGLGFKNNAFSNSSCLLSVTDVRFCQLVLDICHDDLQIDALLSPML